jgi:HlyD family secretion protein
VLLAARADLQRTQGLVGQGFLSQSRLDETRRAVDVAQAQVDAARALRDANAETGTDVMQAQAQLAVASAARQSAQARMKEAEITAPAKARVLARSVEPGQIVQPGRALLTLALSGPLQLVAQVDERYLEQLATGQPAHALADAYPGQAFKAQVLSIAPVVDPQRGAIEVRFDLQAPAPAFLREDMTVSIEVETARREQALVVPVSALRGDVGTEQTVWVARNGQVEARPVRLGLRTLAWVEVLEGLNPGEAVLTGPAPHPGARVRAVTQEPATAQRAQTREDAGAAMTNAMGR